MENLEIYLQPTSTIDSDNEKIREKARLITLGSSNDREKAVKLFYFVRDSIRYSVYMISVFIEDFVASKILEWGKGYCVQKAVLLTALARASGIPSRMAFARIRNHRVPEKVVKMAGGNVFPRHGYNQFFIEGGWVSVAATFDEKLCKEHRLPTVEFDGNSDAILPDRDLDGNPYIEYLEKFDPREDLPFDWVYQAVSKKVGTEKRAWLKPPE
ncbi:MAG: transglutaminase domain-containing protein [Deltaproteobacteria bacterium]|nr:transglutaminase domain-containing protein [Deltaproteobacteria bacterium]